MPVESRHINTSPSCTSQHVI